MPRIDIPIYERGLDVEVRVVNLMEMQRGCPRCGNCVSTRCKEFDNERAAEQAVRLADHLYRNTAATFFNALRNALNEERDNAVVDDVVDDEDDEDEWYSDDDD